MKSEAFGSSHLPGIGLGRAIVVGLVGGLVATAVKTLCEVISPPRPPGVESPLGNALDAVSVRLTGKAMSRPTKSLAEPAVHVLFGTLAGGVYAGIERRAPLIRAGHGGLFGFSFWVLAHEIGLPLMGLSPTPAEMTAREQGNELVSHIAFGVALESARRTMLRKWA